MKHGKTNGMPYLFLLWINRLTFPNSSHKYTLYISADGNYRLQQKNKNGDPDDVALNDGNGYFVETEAYKNYVKHVGECSDVSSSCLVLIPRVLTSAYVRNAHVRASELFVFRTSSSSKTLLLVGSLPFSVPDMGCLCHKAWWTFRRGKRKSCRLFYSCINSLFSGLRIRTTR
jgi:hypothetical protein